MPAAQPEEVYDVAVAGLGPVGQMVALILGQQGHRVLCLEKHPEPYPLPRAVHFDPDVSRLLDWVGVSDEIATFSEPALVYEWQNADRKTLLRFTFPEQGDQGWYGSSMFNQPGLEDSLRGRAAQLPSLTIWNGAELTDFTQDDDGVNLTIDRNGIPHTARAQFLVGSDGANSFVRSHLGVEVNDLGFFYRWLIVDFQPTEPMSFEPANLQVCDPRRPVSSVSGGPGHRRFEFMEMPSDDPETFDTDENAWALMADWGVTPQNATLERRRLYQFQSRWAKQWRHGRVFLAGDAAHQVPPFYGQGLVSGVRDSVNLAWKLDLVLRGAAEQSILDSYDSERGAQVQFTIMMSVELGRVICQLDPNEVAGRDAHFLEHGPDPMTALPPMPPERCGPGLFPGREPDKIADCAGVLAVNGNVTFAGERSDLFDRKAYGKFQLIVDGEKVSEDALRAILEITPAGVEVVPVRILPAGSTPTPGSCEATDDDDRYLPWLRASNDVARIVRPDFYTYAPAKTLEEIAELLTGLRSTLHLTQ